jgi:hypothetical protein
MRHSQYFQVNLPMLSQVIAFDQFCANVQRDVMGVLAMHQVAGGPCSGRGNAPIISGLTIPMSRVSQSGIKFDIKCDVRKSAVKCFSSEAHEAVVTIRESSGSESGSEICDASSVAGSSSRGDIACSSREIAAAAGHSTPT